MTSIPAVPVRSSRHLVGGLVVAAVSAAAWFGWMGWDTTYQTDPATGVTSGPYEAWQVVGCGLTLIAALVTALLLDVRPVPAVSALVVGFVVAWTVTAAGDETGLFMVGAFFLVMGLTPAAAVLSAVVLAVRRRLVR